MNFWTSWCPPCKADMPDLDKAARPFVEGSDAVLLTVNLTYGSRETVEKAGQYINDNNFAMPVLLDIEGKAAQAYNISSIPTTYIIDKQGLINQYFWGPTNLDALKNYVGQFK